MSRSITSNRSAPFIALVAAVLVATSVAGGLLAVLIHVNTLADAFGNKAEMAMPWPMLVLTAAGGVAAARWRGWRGVLGTVAIAVPCLLALGSTSDSETFKPGMPAFAYVYQVLVIAVCALSLVPCGVHIRSLVRRDTAAA